MFFEYSQKYTKIIIDPLVDSITKITFAPNDVLSKH